MKWIKEVYRFLGSIYLAIILITLATLVVIIGTFIESLTDSHLLAAQWTYHHPFFMVLLWLFFINILFSALQRWPFKWRHIPFLITHLGLLMIIGGTILKHKIGLQGNLTILEGSATQQVHLPNTHALHIEKKRVNVNLPIATSNFHKRYNSEIFPDLSVKVLRHYPHVIEKIQTWIKKNYACIVGQNILLVRDWKPSQEIEKFTEMYFEGYSQPWDVVAIKTDRISDLIQEAFSSNLDLKIHSNLNPRLTIVKSLKEVIASPFDFDEGVVNLSLSLSYSTIEGFNHPRLNAAWQSGQSRLQEQLTVQLQGPQALYNLFNGDSWYGEARFTIDLIRKNPLLLIAQDEHEDTHLFFFDCHGRVDSDSFSSTTLGSLVVYNEGHGGYAVQTRLPFPPFQTSRQDKERAVTEILTQEIHQAIGKAPELVPPLRMFKKACELAKINFAKAFVVYLTLWKKSRQLLFSDVEEEVSLKKVFREIDWDQENLLDKQACQWISLLFDRLDYPISHEENIEEFLTFNRWPFSSIKKDKLIKPTELLTDLSQQIFAISRQLPLTPFEVTTANEKARLLAAFFKVHEIDYQILQNFLAAHSSALEYEMFDEFKSWTPTLIETPLATHFLCADPPQKIEDHQSCVILEFCQEKKKERIALAYHPTGLKWPILNGEYLIRYQAQSVDIPYRMRLRQASEIHYPQTRQAYSYESDILISELDKIPTAHTLSMNCVHETWDGYRFYLSGISTVSNQGLKYVNIVVNHDPGKYLLTYPGAMIVFLGVVLLFWFKKAS